MKKPWRRHMVIPDTQVRPGVSIDHFRWIGKYAAAKRPDVIVHLGDHWDMHSLCEYDRHTKVRDFSARSYQADIDAGNRALEMLTREIAKARGYKPHLIMLRGNHEERIERLQGAEPRLREKCSYNDFNDAALGWKPVPFLQPVTLDGVMYCHYFYNPNSGRPYGGTAVYKLGKVHTSFTMGHVQGLDVGRVSLPGGRMLRGLVAGSCYLHDEDYKGPQANNHWRGILMKHEVRRGEYDLMEVSLDFLKRRFG